jgi:hypothetical protein
MRRSTVTLGIATLTVAIGTAAPATAGAERSPPKLIEALPFLPIPSFLGRIRSPDGSTPYCYIYNARGYCVAAPPDHSKHASNP